MNPFEYSVFEIENPFLDIQKIHSPYFERPLVRYPSMPFAFDRGGYKKRQIRNDLPRISLESPFDARFD
jgi:hypothetical protein